MRHANAFPKIAQFHFVVSIFLTTFRVPLLFVIVYVAPPFFSFSKFFILVFVHYLLLCLLSLLLILRPFSQNISWFQHFWHGARTHCLFFAMQTAVASPAQMIIIIKKTQYSIAICLIPVSSASFVLVVSFLPFAHFLCINKEKLYRNNDYIECCLRRLYRCAIHFQYICMYMYALCIIFNRILFNHIESFCAFYTFMNDST